MSAMQARQGSSAAGEAATAATAAPAVRRQEQRESSMRRWLADNPPSQSWKEPVSPPTKGFWRRLHVADSCVLGSAPLVIAGRSPLSKVCPLIEDVYDSVQEFGVQHPMVRGACRGLGVARFGRGNSCRHRLAEPTAGRRCTFILTARR